LPQVLNHMSVIQAASDVLYRVTAANTSDSLMPAASISNSRFWHELTPVTTTDTLRGFCCCREVAADSEEGKLPLHGPNQW
jgi:hypothetical protein